MQAWLGETIVAEADEERLVQIEGQLYFPADSVRWALFEDSATAYTCPWKGKAQYWSVRTPTWTYVDTAWTYPTPSASAIERVGLDFTGFVAFDPIEVTLLESSADLGLF